MPIPPLESDYLPEGIYDCTLDEIKERFTTTETRKELVENLSRYIDKIREAGIGGWLIVNGSFVTSKDEPGDIDIVLVISEDCDYSLLAPITYWEYTILSMDYVKDNYRLHLFVGVTVENPDDDFDNTAKWIIGRFSHVKGEPDMKKGILRVRV